MIPIEQRRMVCTSCGEPHNPGEVLRAPNPFDPLDEVFGCKRCRHVNLMCFTCDEPGCWDVADCGFKPGDGPYRQTCSKHYATLNR